MENPFEIILERLNTIENLLRSSKKTEPVLIAPVNEIFNIEQAADYLGLAKSTLYKMTSSRMIPHSKISGKIIFKRSELDELITKHKIKTRQEIEQEASIYLSKRQKY
jgi:excisionase family DNA binding protein